MTQSADAAQGTGPGTAGRDGLPLLAEVIDLMSEVVARPGADARDRAGSLARQAAEGSLADAELAARLGAFAAADAADLDVEYVRLFLQAREEPAHPYESFYRTGLLVDPACLGELAELFAAAGVTPVDEGAPMDHLGVELAFLALLLRGLAGASDGAATDLRAIAGEVMKRHLVPFVGAFRARLAALAPAPYFALAADVLACALEAVGAAVSPAAPAGPVGPASSLTAPGTPA